MLGLMLRLGSSFSFQQVQKPLLQGILIQYHATRVSVLAGKKTLTLTVLVRVSFSTVTVEGEHRYFSCITVLSWSKRFERYLPEMCPRG